MKGSKAGSGKPTISPSRSVKDGSTESRELAEYKRYAVRVTTRQKRPEPISKSASTGRSREYEDKLKVNALPPPLRTHVTRVSNSNNEGNAQAITAIPEGGGTAEIPPGEPCEFSLQTMHIRLAPLPLKTGHSLARNADTAFVDECERRYTRKSIVYRVKKF
jgi:hypothetical protein